MPWSEDAIREIEALSQDSDEINADQIKKAISILARHYCADKSNKNQLTLLNLVSALKPLTELPKIIECIRKHFDSCRRLEDEFLAAFPPIKHMLFKWYGQKKEEKKGSKVKPSAPDLIQLCSITNLQPSEKIKPLFSGLSPDNIFKDNRIFVYSLHVISEYFLATGSMLLPYLQRVQSIPLLSIGNDPPIIGLEQYSKKEKDKNPIVFLGIGGLRSLELAIRLSNKKTIPIVFVIDFSNNVFSYWTKLQKLIKECDSEAVFYKSLDGFLRESAQYTLDKNECTEEYLRALIQFSGFDFFKRTLSSMIIAKNTWAEPCIPLLKQLFDAFQLKDVYVYASNLIAYNDPEIGAALDNISLLEPRLAIHTDACGIVGRTSVFPMNVYLIEPQNIKNTKKMVMQVREKVTPEIIGNRPAEILSFVASLSRMSSTVSPESFSAARSAGFLSKRTGAKKLDAKAITSNQEALATNQTGTMLLKQGQYKKAIEKFEQVVAYWGKDDHAKASLQRVLFNLGTSLLRDKQWEKAQIHLTEAVKLDQELHGIAKDDAPPNIFQARLKECEAELASARAEALLML